VFFSEDETRLLQKNVENVGPVKSGGLLMEIFSGYIGSRIAIISRSGVSLQMLVILGVSCVI
jgi:hypothetical protein